MGLEVGIGKLWDGCLEVEVGPQLTEALSFQTFDKALGDSENFDPTKTIAKIARSRIRQRLVVGEVT